MGAIYAPPPAAAYALLAGAHDPPAGANAPLEIIFFLFGDFFAIFSILGVFLYLGAFLLLFSPYVNLFCPYTGPFCYIFLYIMTILGTFLPCEGLFAKFFSV